MPGEEMPVAVALRAAADLKLAAVQLSNEDGGARRQRFAEILQAAEKKLAPQQHPDFYRSLSRWFPDAGGPAQRPPVNSRIKLDPNEDSGIALTDPEPAAPTADSLVAQLKKLLPTLDEADRKALAGELGELLPMQQASNGSGAPIAASPSKGSGLKLAPETLSLLGVSADSVDCERLAPLFTLLIEMLVRLDDVAWEVWGSFGSDSKGLRREVVLRKVLAAMLQGKPKLTMAQVQFQIAQLLRLNVGLLGQVTCMADHVSGHLNVINPEVLTKEEEPAGWSPLKSLSARCWERFEQLWPEVESGLRGVINKEVAKKVSGDVNAQRF